MKMNYFPSKPFDLSIIMEDQAGFLLSIKEKNPIYMTSNIDHIHAKISKGIKETYLVNTYTGIQFHFYIINQTLSTNYFIFQFNK